MRFTHKKSSYHANSEVSLAEAFYAGQHDGHAGSDWIEVMGRSNIAAAPSAKRTVWLLGALTAMAPVALDAYLPAMMAIGRDLNAPAGQVQSTVAVFLAGMAIGQLIHGPISDRWGRKRPMLIGVAIYIIASIGCACAWSGEVLTSWRFVQALGACSGAVISRAAIRDQFAHSETARMLSLMVMIVGVAPILAPLAGGMIYELAGWRAIFGVSAAFGAALFVASARLMTESCSTATSLLARSQHPARTYLLLLRNPLLLRYVLAGACHAGIVLVYIAFSPILFIQLYGVAPTSFALIFGINAFGMTLAGIVNRALVRRFSPEAVLRAAIFVTVSLAVLLVSILIFTAGSPGAVLPIILGLLVTYGFVQPNTIACALNVDPMRSGSISALCGALMFGVGALASSAAGSAYNGTAIPFALTVLTLACASGAALSFKRPFRPGNLER